MLRIRNQYPGRRTRGLTLGEMLVVLTVFSILALMFFMSSTHALVKTRMSRVLHEERLLASALQRYEADYLQLPSERQGLARLTEAANGYLTQVPIDPFTQGRDTRQYYYLRDLSNKHRWVIISAGPDGQSDIMRVVDGMRSQIQLSGAQPNATLLTAEEAGQFITENTYDPTNGTISAGDIISVYGE